ncbi:MAG: TlpA family protein disulfide reductase [Chloroflexi bacterium]|nr:TlpA family protein disulfide reductase [Chloroflexota bacterium]
MSSNPSATNTSTPTAVAPPANPWIPRLTALGVALGVIALLWLLVWGLGKRAQGTVGLTPSTLRSAPPFSVALFDLPAGRGQTFTLSDQLGKPVLVNFWASWCVPCEDEAPALGRAWQRYRDRVAFIGVDVQDTDQAAQAFIARLGVAYPNGMDRSGEISIAYGMTGVPESYFITPTGQIARKWAGPLNDAQLGQFLDELLR